jgi:hypothetical protein
MLINLQQLLWCGGLIRDHGVVWRWRWTPFVGESISIKICRYWGKLSIIVYWKSWCPLAFSFSYHTHCERKPSRLLKEKGLLDHAIVKEAEKSLITIENRNPNNTMEQNLHSAALRKGRSS